MSFDTETKQTIISENAKGENDTGSAYVQIALIHERIKHITEHLRSNPKDNHSRMGLRKLVGQRRRLEGFLRERDLEGYRELIKKLGIREVKPR